MGFQDALYKLNIPFSEERARDFADESMERISYTLFQHHVIWHKKRVLIQPIRFKVGSWNFSIRYA